MLVQYAVENYRSIKDEIVINFRTDEKYRDSEWVIQGEEFAIPLYKGIGMIGPNASGKTNIIQSFDFAIRFILNTIKRRDDSKINVEKFAFDERMDREPTFFEFVFYNNKVKYVYGFSISTQEVLEEYLEGYFSEGKRVLFERYPGQRFEFGGIDTEIQEEIAKKTNPNRLYMPVAAEWGYVPLKEAYQWFGVYPGRYGDLNVSSMVDEIIQKENRKKIFISELQKADFNIKDIYIKNRKMDKKSHDILQRFLRDALGEDEDFLLPDISPYIRIVHEDHMGQTFETPLDEDSAGTKSFVQDLAELLYLGGRGGIMLKDELGKDYHTKLIRHFLGMFRSSVIDTSHTQILFTTHNTKILDMLNPDQIYLVDKDGAGATVVKLLDDYLIHENEDIELGYLKGRYGGVPYMKG